MEEDNQYTSLAELITRGGVHYNLQGSNVEKILTDLVATIPLPTHCNQNTLLTAMLEREALMPTAIGDGIALPHPRAPLITERNKQLVAICFPDRPVNWHALDGKPVHSVICILSASPKDHLRSLSRISYLCRQGPFATLLAHHASREEILEELQKAEEVWANR